VIFIFRATVTIVVKEKKNGNKRKKENNTLEGISAPQLFIYFLSFPQLQDSCVHKIDIWVGGNK